MKRQTRAKVKGRERLHQHEWIPLIGRDGGKPGEIFQGYSHANYGLVIKIVEGEIKPCPRRGHMVRVIESDEYKSEKKRYKDLCKHMDFPFKKIKGHEEEFQRIARMFLDVAECRDVIPKVFKDLYPESADANEEKDARAIAYCNEIDFDFEAKNVPAHQCVNGVKFLILDTGTGNRSSAFSSVLQQKGEDTPVTFDDIAMCIRDETGDGKASFFLNLHNIYRIHPLNVEYKHEDEFAKQYRQENAHRLPETFSAYGASNAPNSIPRETWYYRYDSVTQNVTLVNTPLEDGDLHKDNVVQRYSSVAFPGIVFEEILHKDDLEDGRMTANDVNDAPRCGLTAGVLKSLLQKQTRRMLVDPALSTTAEIAKIPTIFNQQSRTATNGFCALLQRLVVICIEDVGCCMELSAICWMACVAMHQPHWRPTRYEWNFILAFVWSMVSRKERRSYLEGPSSRIEEGPEDGIKQMREREHAALALGIEFRCREPGMAGDKVMMGRVIHEILHNGKAKFSYYGWRIRDFDSGVHPVTFDIPWDKSFIYDLVPAVDFHAYPAVVDRIFEEEPKVMAHYMQESRKKVKGSRKRKSSAVDALRSDMWDTSSSINVRDSTSKRQRLDDEGKYFDEHVMPVYTRVVHQWLDQKISV